ncbi:methyl-accepting chemotaxis protein [Paenibacillus hexagrammi]|uniref:Methyl-accepting chemotaxis protein n=1 Tax=Paenibacillus hexagrammi TaxID=2908839 RepID=A0ABY3SHT5_9BACL|nr:methyl-accepting chemotaxis protein [Paenibacillus sp. YPD9-1]UJF33608.1 methyl-accepting chemotaxis protein [Paenibacillus sp. YPD9-1]
MDDLASEYNRSGGLFENLFVMLGTEVILDGVGGKSLGYVAPPEDTNAAQPDAGGQPPAMTFDPSTPFVGNPAPSPISGKPTITIMAWIPGKDSNPSGTVGLPIELNALTKNIVNNGTDDIQQTLVVDSTGVVISSANAEHVLAFDFSKEQGENLAFWEQMKKNESNFGFFTMDGVSNIASFQKSDKYNMYVITYMPMTHYEAATNQLVRGLVTVLIIALVLSSLIIYFFARRLTRPVRIAAEHLKVVATGDFSKSIPEKYKQSKDETGLLMTSIDTMRDSIKTMTGSVIKESELLDNNVRLTNQHITELNKQIEEVTSTTEEMSAGIQQAAASAEEVNATANEIGQSVQTIAAKAESGAMNSQDISKRAHELKESAVISKASANDIRENLQSGLREAIEQTKAVEQIHVLTDSILKLPLKRTCWHSMPPLKQPVPGKQGKASQLLPEKSESSPKGPTKP